MKLTAILIEGNMRYEKNLAQHFVGVAIGNIFPHRNETEVAKLKWSTRAWKDGVQIKEN